MRYRSFPADWFLRARLKLRHLQLFLALDEHRNLNRAAASLNLSQPAASKLLGDLEAAMGVSLFDRHTRGVEPNWYGALMIRHARLILSELKEVGAELNALQAGHSGRVVIGAVSAPAVEFVTQAIDNVQRGHPHLQIVVEVESSNILLDLLQHGRLDFALARLSKALDPSMFDYEEVGEEELSFIVRDSHPLSKLDRPVLLEDLLHCSWGLPPRGTLLRDRVDAMFRAGKFPPPQRVIESASPVFLMAMAARTECITVLSSALGEVVQAPGSFVALPFAPHFAVEPYGIVRLRDRPLSPGAALLLDAVRAAMRRDAPPSQPKRRPSP